MRELLLQLAKALVDHPEAVEVREVRGDRSIIFEVKVHSDDVGKLIGRKGRIIEALRTIFQAASAKQHMKSNIELV